MAVETHLHNGVDSPQIEYPDLLRAPNLIVTEVVGGAAAQVKANYDKFFIAPYQCEVVSIDEVHTTAETTANPMQLRVQRLRGVEATGSGDNLLASVFDLRGTAETVQNGVLVDTDVKILEKGNRLALNLVQASANELTHVVVTVQLKRLDYVTTQ